ncbi:hypothetical protein QCA50_006038 [Cerrena zonata]|uniref:Uncharacterized protein n=1 Tax=Cerrena zonata TaxID=2478898 RepID=A0AAW0GI81_9APHY
MSNSTIVTKFGVELPLLNDLMLPVDSLSKELLAKIDGLLNADWHEYERWKTRNSLSRTDAVFFVYSDTPTELLSAQKHLDILSTAYIVSLGPRPSSGEDKLITANTKNHLFSQINPRSRTSRVTLIHMLKDDNTFCPAWFSCWFRLSACTLNKINIRGGQLCPPSTPSFLQCWLSFLQHWTPFLPHWLLDPSLLTPSLLSSRLTVLHLENLTIPVDAYPNGAVTHLHELVKLQLNHLDATTTRRIINEMLSNVFPVLLNSEESWRVLDELTLCILGQVTETDDTSTIEWRLPSNVTTLEIAMESHALAELRKPHVPEALSSGLNHVEIYPFADDLSDDNDLRRPLLEKSDDSNRSRPVGFIFTTLGSQVDDESHRVIEAIAQRVNQDHGEITVVRRRKSEIEMWVRERHF